MTDTPAGMTDKEPSVMTDTPTLTSDTTDEGLTLAEAAAMLHVSERTVLRRIEKGQIQGYKVDAGRGEVWRVLLDGMTDTQAAHRAAVTDTPPQVAVVTDTEAGDASATVEQAPAPEALALVQLVDRLQRENTQLAGQLGFVQARLQDAEEQIRLLPAPDDLAEVETRARVAEAEREQLQARAQELERTIALLQAPRDEPPAAEAEPKRLWWQIWKR